MRQGLYVAHGKPRNLRRRADYQVGVVAIIFFVARSGCHAFFDSGW